MMVIPGEKVALAFDCLHELSLDAVSVMPSNEADACASSDCCCVGVDVPLGVVAVAVAFGTAVCVAMGCGVAVAEPRVDPRRRGADGDPDGQRDDQQGGHREAGPQRAAVRGHGLGGAHFLRRCLAGVAARSARSTGAAVASLAATARRGVARRAARAGRRWPGRRWTRARYPCRAGRRRSAAG